MKVKEPRHICGNRFVSSLAICLAATWLTSCSTVGPAQRFDREAERAGLSAGWISTGPFTHRTYTGTGASSSQGPLHVYFTGDGSPFLGRTRIATDPTPRQPVSLQLMLRDPHPSILLGRPCYHGARSGCQPRLWTTERYSNDVVTSMAVATRRLIESNNADPVVLIGYSGGGVLALLVAERLVEVDAVITVAANLDTEAWTELHGYTPLSGSINPAELARRRDELVHLHLIGADDRNVPPDSRRRALAALPPDSASVIPGFDHRCCWEDLWPQILTDVERRLGSRQEASSSASDT